MICEKCGKSNIAEVKQCIYCKADMPETSGGGGFADILSFSLSGDVTPLPKKTTTQESVENLNEEKILQKIESLQSSNNMNILLSLIAVGLSILLFISSIVFGVITISKINKLTKVNDNVTTEITMQYKKTDTETKNEKAQKNNDKLNKEKDIKDNGKNTTDNEKKSIFEWFKNFKNNKK